MSFLVLFSFLTPVGVVQAKGLIPDCGIVEQVQEGDRIVSKIANPCNFTYFMQLINGVIKFLLFTIATPFIAIIIMYVGYLFLTSGGNPSQGERAKHILSSVIIGYIVALGAWLIVNTITKSLLKSDSDINTFLKE